MHFLTASTLLLDNNVFSSINLRKTCPWYNITCDFFGSDVVTWWCWHKKPNKYQREIFAHFKYAGDIYGTRENNWNDYIQRSSEHITSIRTSVCPSLATMIHWNHANSSSRKAKSNQESQWILEIMRSQNRPRFILCPLNIFVDTEPRTPMVQLQRNVECREKRLFPKYQTEHLREQMQSHRTAVSTWIYPFLTIVCALKTQITVSNGYIPNLPTQFRSIPCSR